MVSTELATVSDVQLPTAVYHQVYDIWAVEARLAKVPEGSEHDALRKLYQDMLVRWPMRFSVKPSRMPAIERLYDNLPNFHDVLDDVRRATALALSWKDALEITPTLLLGPPWVGKTHFARQVADLLGTGNGMIPMSSNTAWWILSGSSSQWKWAKPGKIFETLVNGHYANPVIVVDEIDKAAKDAQYDPVGALYGLLEHDTARSFVDEYAEVPIDVSRAIWFVTANDERSIPSPILSRMNIHEILPPTPEQARVIAGILYTEIRSAHDWGERFDATPSGDVLDYAAWLWPREMRRALVTAFGNARLDNRYTVTPDDFPKAWKVKQGIWFIN